MKPVHWMGSTLADLRDFPEEVQDDIGYALYEAQTGARSSKAKPLKGFGGAGVLEIVETMTAMPTVRSIRSNSLLRSMSCTSFRRNPSAGLRRPSTIWT